MTTVAKNYAFVVAALIIFALPPLISDSVFHAIRVRFHTVGIQSPIENYQGDALFFLVVTAFLLAPWTIAIAFRIKGISDWAALVPLLALIICWLLRQRERPIDTQHIVSWISYIGYSCAAIGSVGSARQERRWIQLIWLPAMFFLILFVAADWCLDVFME